jgi:D-alanyl-D-alanine carboxypeptidase (penicillin-binding protein 5/6)
MPIRPDAPVPAPFSVQRRSLLLPAVAALTLGGLPAFAQPRSASRAPAGPAPSPAETPLGPFDTIARLALVVDADTGAVLLEKNADEQMPPSSTCSRPVGCS